MALTWDRQINHTLVSQLQWKENASEYFTEASSINLKRSIRYGIGCLWTALNFRLARMGIIRSRLYAGLAWIDAFIMPRALSAVLLIKAVRRDGL